MTEKETIELVFKQKKNILNDFRNLGYSIATRVTNCILHSEDSRRGIFMEGVFKEAIYSIVGNPSVNAVHLDYKKNADADLYIHNGECGYVCEIKLDDDHDSKKKRVEKEEIKEKAKRLSAELSRKVYPVIVYLTSMEREDKIVDGVWKIYGMARSISVLTECDEKTLNKAMDLISDRFNGYDANPKTVWDTDFVNNLIEQAGAGFVSKILMDEDMRKIASALSPNNEMFSAMDEGLHSVTFKY